MENAILVGYVLRHLLIPSLLPQTQESAVEQAATGAGAGALTVQYWSESPGPAPRGATRVPFATLQLSASCDADITVEQIDVRHVGLGESRDVQGVYLMSGFRRLSRSTTFSDSGRTASLRMRGVTVPRCGAMEIQVLGDIAPDAHVAGEHGIELVGVAGIESDAASVRVERGTDRVRVRTSPTAAGALSVVFLRTHDRLSYNRLVTVARMQVSADNVTDHVLRRVTLTNGGTARNHDLEDLYLETSGGEVVSNVVAKMDGNTVSLTFDPSFHVKRGQTRVLELKALVKGSAYKTVSFSIEEDGDLYAVPFKRNR